MSSKVVAFDFTHGLGDCVHFAHIAKLWVDRGYEVQLGCKPDKEVLFRAAGCRMIKPVSRRHFFGHPPAQAATMVNDWAENKIAHNLINGPLPSIGGLAEVWPQLLKVNLRLPVPEKRAEIDAYLDSLPGKPILLHTRANSSASAKNLNEAQERELYRLLLAGTSNPLFLLDWDNRVSRYSNYRVRHMRDDFRSLSLSELAYVMDRSALLIGVDSGPLHLTRFTSVPALGLWFGHHPARFALPRAETLHLTKESDHTVWSAKRRHSFHIADVPAVNPETIARFAVKLVAGEKPTDLVLDNVLSKLTTWKGDGFRDRERTVRAALAHLRTKAAPRIVETGCVREAEDWTAGFSTYVFGLFLRNHGAGHLDSVDNNGNHCALAREWCEPFKPFVSVHTADSLAFLEKHEGRADLVFLDSLDTDEAGHEEHGLEEAKRAVPLVEADGLILFDDTAYSGRGEFKGKGGKAVPWLLANGWEVREAGYQVLLGRKGDGCI